MNTVVDNVIVGHLPTQLSWILSLLILRNATINCIIIERRYSADLPQGGLENFCKQLFGSKQKEIDKLNCLLSYKATSVTNE